MVGLQKYIGVDGPCAKCQLVDTCISGGEEVIIQVLVERTSSIRINMERIPVLSTHFTVLAALITLLLVLTSMIRHVAGCVHELIPIIMVRRGPVRRV